MSLKEITKEELMKYQLMLTVGRLKEFLEKSNLPDDAPVLIQRVEDHYYESGNWGVYVKLAEHYYDMKEVSKKEAVKIYNERKKENSSKDKKDDVKDADTDENKQEQEKKEPKQEPVKMATDEQIKELEALEVNFDGLCKAFKLSHLNELTFDMAEKAIAKKKEQK